MPERPSKQPKTRVTITESPDKPGTSHPQDIDPEHHSNEPLKTTEKRLLAVEKEKHVVRFQVVAGSYDKILYGLQIQSTDGSESLEMKPLFIFPAHISCVKAVSASPGGGKWLATGGTDETIKIWDLKRRRELGSLQQHSGKRFAPFSSLNLITSHKRPATFSYPIRARKDDPY